MMLALILASAPLDVRVLEREQLKTAHVEATALTCDGAPLASPAELTASGPEVLVGKRHCTEVSASGPTSIRAGSLERRYAGTLVLTASGNVLRLLNRIDVEAYLPAVVAAELGDAPPEALKAQAIVSRTFALADRRRHASAGYDLCDLAHCQAYRGLTEETKGATAAVEATSHQVLLLGGVALKPTYFHAACGGKTSTAQDVFADEFRSVAVSDVVDGKPACADLPDFEWTWSVPSVDLVKALGGAPDAPAFVALKRDSGGRVVELTSFGKRYSGNRFLAQVTRSFGWQTLRSMHVEVTDIEGTLTFTGRGVGHGVGLCQQGARHLAEKKATAAAILKRYYPESLVKSFE